MDCVERKVCALASSGVQAGEGLGLGYGAHWPCQNLRAKGVDRKI